MTESPLSENAIAGMALAAFELDRAILAILVMSKVAPKRLIIEMVEQCLMRVEEFQMSGHPSLVEPAKAARIHILSIIRGLEGLPGLEGEMRKAEGL